MIIITAKGARFDTSKPALSSTCMILDSNGEQVMDALRLTGRMTTVTEFNKSTSMVEVEFSFGKTEINEDFLWQRGI